MIVQEQASYLEHITSRYSWFTLDIPTATTLYCHVLDLPSYVKWLTQQQGCRDTVAIKVLWRNIAPSSKKLWYVAYLKLTEKWCGHCARSKVETFVLYVHYVLTDLCKKTDRTLHRSLIFKS